MKEMVICKSCGYIMEKDKLKDKCPACGVAAKMFQPHDERISPKRKFILSLDLHPVMVHFPQAFAVTIFILSLAGLIAHGEGQAQMTATIHLLGLALPVVVLAAFFAGIVDGTVRFRRVSTPILIKKIAIGIIFFILSCGVAALVQFRPLATSMDLLLVMVCSIACIACATTLGLLGTGLLNARFPG